MSDLTSLSIQSGGTISVTGGTTQTFGQVGPISSGILKVSDVGNTDLIGAANATFKYDPPKRRGDGSYTKPRWTVTTQIPWYNTVTGLYEYRLVASRIEETVASIADGNTAAALINDHCLILKSAHCVDFFSTGKVS